MRPHNLLVHVNCCVNYVPVMNLELNCDWLWREDKFSPHAAMEELLRPQHWDLTWVLAMSNSWILLKNKCRRKSREFLLFCVSAHVCGNMLNSKEQYCKKHCWVLSSDPSKKIRESQGYMAWHTWLIGAVSVFLPQDTVHISHLLPKARPRGMVYHLAISNSLK